jgi:uncharacterized short protein YbdD (DUF466 family)
MAKVWQILLGIWGVARELVGDNAYTRYRQYVVARGDRPMTPQEFYLSELQRKYSRPSRCC